MSLQPSAVMERTSSSAWIKGLASLFAAEAVDVPRLFRDAGIDTARLEDPYWRMPSDQVSQLWNLAIERSGNMAMGMDRTRTQRHVNFDLIVYPLMSSPDLYDGLQRLSRYLALLSDATTIELTPGALGQH